MRGVPVSVNGQELGPVALLETLNAIGAKHGVGRVDLVENRLVGMKSHGVYETPGGTLLYKAHQGLEELTLDRDTMHFKDMLAVRYAELIYNGQWWSPLRRSLTAFFSETQRNVTGSARLKVFKGAAHLVGRQAERSLYVPDLATFGAETVYNQADAEGFIKLFGLPQKVEALIGADQ